MRPIHEIADEIIADWDQVYFGARPYLEAMLDLNTVDETYGYDSARSILLYFLSNASSWRGPVAREIKAEIKAMLKR